jgi:hypothetical protein
MLVRMTVAHITANYGRHELRSMRRLCGIVHSIYLTERTVAADGRKRRLCATFWLGVLETLAKGVTMKARPQLPSRVRIDEAISSPLSEIVD